MPTKKEIAESLDRTVSRVMSELANRRWKNSTKESRKLALKPAHDARRKPKGKAGIEVN